MNGNIVRMTPKEREENLRLLPDTHAHLGDDAFAEDRDSVMERAARAGVRRVLAVGSDLASSRAAVACAQRYPEVYAAVGLHPHEADRFRDEAPAIKALLGAPKVVAVGEIGLDQLRSGVSLEEQMHVFQAQLEWAQEWRLPVTVHNREADSEVLQTLCLHDVTAVLHCFSGSGDTAAAAVKAGYFISFAGNLTFRNADALRGTASQVPLDRILVETDSPVLAPQPWRGQRNEPAHVVAVCEVLGQIRGLGFEDMAERVWKTADAVFDWDQT